MPYAKKQVAPSESPLSSKQFDELLTPLTSPSEAKERTELLAKWVLKGWISTAQCNAATKAIDQWTKLELAEQDRRRMADLEGQVKELEEALKFRRGKSAA